MKALIPRDWRKRRGCFPRSGRFDVGHVGYDLRPWMLADDAYATLLTFPTKREALDAARFARAYVKRWGDIDLGSFPYNLDDALEYDDEGHIQRWWAKEYPPKGTT